MKNLIIAAVLLMPAAAGAQQNIKFGNLEINPFVSTQESYDSNIYLEKKLAKSASINRSSIGVNLVEKLGSRYDLMGGYSMDILGYSRATTINNAVHHNANLSASAQLPKSITVTVDDSYKQTTDQATSELTTRAKRVENTAGLEVESPLRGKFGFTVALQHVYNNYLESSYNVLDREETLVGADLSYKLQPKTKLFFSYRYGNLNYRTSDNGDAISNNMDLGITGNIAPKVVGTVKAGVQMRHYAKDLATAKNTLTTGGYSAQAVWKPLEKTDVILFAKRANVESSYLDSRFYTSTLTDITVTRQVKKIKAGVGISYEGVQYPEKNVSTNAKRLDKNTNVRLTAEYNIQKWLKADLGYTYKDRTSNEKGWEYKDNIVALGLKAMF